MSQLRQCKQICSDSVWLTFLQCMATAHPEKKKKDQCGTFLPFILIQIEMLASLSFRPFFQCFLNILQNSSRNHIQSSMNPSSSSQEAVIEPSANVHPSCASSKTSPTLKEMTLPRWPIIGILARGDSGVVMATVAQGNNFWRATWEPVSAEMKALMVVGRKGLTVPPRWPPSADVSKDSMTQTRPLMDIKITTSPARFTAGTDTEQPLVDSQGVKTKQHFWLNNIQEKNVYQTWQPSVTRIYSTNLTLPLAIQSVCVQHFATSGVRI